MKFLTQTLILSLLTLPQLVQAETSCRDAYTLTLTGAELHLNKPAVNEELISKSGPVYLDFKDPYKVMLIESEVQELLKNFQNKKSETLTKLKNNDCSNYNLLDDKVKEGETRWKALLKEALEDSKIKETPEIIRDSGNLKPFTSLDELKKYSRSFVAQFVKMESSGAHPKNLTTIKKDFTKLYLDNKRKRTPKPDDQANLITRALFLSMDPHSDYISEEQAANFKMAVSANLQGVGLALKEDEMGAKVAKVIKNGPADKSGKFKNGDLLTKVDDKPLANLGLDEVVDLIRGKEGTKVKLEYSRLNSKTKKRTVHAITLTRAIIPLEEQRVKAQTLKYQNKNIAVINVPSFYADAKRPDIGTAMDVLREYKKLKAAGKIDLIVLDLRNDGGGLLDESIRLVGLFINEPVAVQVKSREGVRHFKAAPAPLLITEPLIVLINKYSASASEIVAGALKDYHRGIIVGDNRTYGKGSVQSVIDKSSYNLDLGIIKVTTGQFFTPSGSSTQFKGVTSQVVIPSSSQLQDLGEENLKYAIPWSQVDSALPKDLPNISKYVPDLQKKSLSRIKANEEFKKYDSMANYRKYIDEKLLNPDEPEEDSENDDNRFDLKKDIILKESLNIAVDYLQELPKVVSSQEVEK